MFKTNYLTQFNDEHNDWIEGWLKGDIDTARVQKHFKWVQGIKDSHRDWNRQHSR